MPTVDFKAKIDGSQFDTFKRQAKKDLKEIASESKVLAKVLGDGSIAKYAKLASVGLSGFGVGAGITLAIAGIEKLGEKIAKANEQWKEHIALVDQLAKEYNTSNSMAEAYFRNVQGNTPKKPGESQDEFTKRVNTDATENLKMITEAIKEAIKPENRSRLENFKNLGVGPEMLRPGNEAAISMILRKNTGTQVDQLTGALGTAKNAMNFLHPSGVEMHRGQGEIGASLIKDFEDQREQAAQAEFKNVIRKDDEELAKLADQKGDAQLRLNKLIEKQSELTRTNLADEERWKEMQKDRIALEAEIKEKTKQHNQEIHDVKLKNTLDGQTKEQRIYSLKDEMAKAKTQMEGFAPGTDDRRKAEVKLEQMKGELQGAETEKQKAQFELDSAAKQKAWQMAGAEFSSRAQGSVRVGGFAGTNATATSDIGKETNSILKMIHKVLLDRYKENTFGNDKFTLQ